MENHTLITQEVVSRQIASQFFQTVALCPETEIAEAIEWIKSATITLSLSDCVKSFTEFATGRGISLTKASPLLEALFSLEGLRSSLKIGGSALLELLAKDSKEQLKENDEKIESTKSLLLRFFENSSKFDTTLKAQRVYDGLLPNYESCSSLVEFRPIFDANREKFSDGIVSATLTIEMRSQKPDNLLERTSIQLDMTDIEHLTSELNKLRAKIAALAAFAKDAKIELLNPSRSLKSGSNATSSQ